MELYKGKYFEVVFEDWCQEFPGACIVSGHKECLGDMTSDEWQELGILEKELERVCKKVFGATMFNFACLMNNAYRDVIYETKYQMPLMITFLLTATASCVNWWVTE